MPLEDCLWHSWPCQHRPRRCIKPCYQQSDGWAVGYRFFWSLCKSCCPPSPFQVVGPCGLPKVDVFIIGISKLARHEQMWSPSFKLARCTQYMISIRLSPNFFQEEPPKLADWPCFWVLAGSPRWFWVHAW